PALRGARRVETEPVIEPAQPHHQMAEERAAEPRSGLLSRMPQLIRRAVPVEPLVTAAAASTAASMANAGPEDRIKARINDVIRSRVRPPIQAQSPLQAAISRREPPVNRRGPQPLIATRAPQQPAQGVPASAPQARI